MPADSDVAPLCVTVTPFFARSRRRRTWTVSGSSRCIRLLHLLRDTDESDLAPQPSAAQLPELVEVFRAAGLDVDLVLDGSTDGLPAGVDLDLRSGRGRVEQHGRLELASTGRGLVGMRERVAVFGGDLDATTTDDGGYVVRARLPLATTA